MKGIGLLNGDLGIDGLQFIKTETKPVGNQDVLVEIHRLGLNPSDYRICLPSPVPRNFPFIPGSDIAGIVKEIGSNVNRLKVGDVVYGKNQIPKFFGMQEYLTIEEEYLVKKPENISLSQAATIPVTFQTAYMNLIKKGKLQKGQNVLVLGGAGGVGATAVQIAKALGAKVYCTVLSTDIELAKKNGADIVIDSLKDNLEDLNDKMDLVMDTIGTKYQFEAYKVMKKGANLVSCAEDPEKETAQKYGVNALPFEFATGNHEQLEFANELIEKGQYNPSFSEEIEFEPEAIKEALYQIKQGSHKGRIVVKIK